MHLSNIGIALLSNMSDNIGKIYDAPSNLKLKVWKRFGLWEYKVGQKADHLQAM